MKLVNLYGGLGNQLFQYSFGKALRKSNSEIGVVYVADMVDGTSIRNPHGVNISDFLSVPIDVRRQELVNLIGKARSHHISRRFFHRYADFRFLAPRCVFDDPKEPVDLATLARRHNVYFHGEWQRPHVIQQVLYEVAAEVGEGLSAHFGALGEGRVPDVPTADICVHLRFGDFAVGSKAQKVIGLLGRDYYKAALDLAAREFGAESVLLVTNDRDKARSFAMDMGVHDAIIQQSNDQLFDFLTLSCSALLISSNSTFCWWAALLASLAGSRVISPQFWSRVPSSAEGFNLDHWVQIDNELW